MRSKFGEKFGEWSIKTELRATADAHCAARAAAFTISLRVGCTWINLPIRSIEPRPCMAVTASAVMRLRGVLEGGTQDLSIVALHHCLQPAASPAERSATR